MVVLETNLTMKTHFLTSLFSTLCLISSAQFIDQYGIYVQHNASDQQVRLEDHSFGWGVIYTWGIGAYGIKTAENGLDFKYRLTYTQKGFHDSLTSNDELIYSNRNELDYLSVDLLIQKVWREGFFRPYLAAGVSGTVLVRKEVADFLGSSSFLGIPALSPDDFNTLGLGSIYNLGATFGKVFFIEGGLWIDLLPALKQPGVEIRNVLFTVAVGIHVSEVLKNR